MTIIRGQYSENRYLAPKPEALKKLLILFSLVLSAFTGFSQDTLYFRNDSVEVVNVMDYNFFYVKYRSIDSTSSVNYWKSNDEIKSIHFANGETHVMSNVSRIKESEVRKRAEIWGINAVTFDVVDLAVNGITLHYMHTFPEAKNLTIGFPISVSYNTLKGVYDKDEYYSSNGYYNQNKVFSSGVDIMSCPNRFIIGLSIDAGYFKASARERLYDPSLGQYENNNNAFSGDVILTNSAFWGGFLRTGYFYNQDAHFVAGAMVDLGVVREEYITSATRNIENNVVTYDTYIQTPFRIRFKLKIGYTFN